jgi:hypothetical protein
MGDKTFGTTAFEPGQSVVKNQNPDWWAPLFRSKKESCRKEI